MYETDKCTVQPVAESLALLSTEKSQNWWMIGRAWKPIKKWDTVTARRKTLLDRLDHANGVKLKFHWNQFPRNFPVANVTGKSPTSYEEAGDFQTISTCQDGLAMSPTSS